MDTQNQVSTLNFKKLGLLAMAPIALVIHGLVLWIPVNTETKKEKEPEKKEELQAIGDMPLPIAAPIATPSSKATPSTPAANPSAAASSPVVIEKVIERVIETKSQPKPSESTKPTTPTPSVSPSVTPEVVTPEDTISKVLGGFPCPSGKKCSRVPQSQDWVLNALANQYKNKWREIYDQPSVNGIRPDDDNSKFIAYKIQDKQTNDFLYFTLIPVIDNGNKVDVQFLSKQEVLKMNGVL